MLEHYWERNGSFPESLDELTPLPLVVDNPGPRLGDFTKNPFTDKLLIYEKTDDTALVVFTGKDAVVGGEGSDNADRKLTLKRVEDGWAYNEQ